MTYQCDVKKAGEVEFRCYFQLAMMIIGGKWKPKVLFHSEHCVWYYVVVPPL